MSAINQKYPELTKLLATFTLHVITDNPSNLVLYASEYFNNLKLKERQLSEEIMEESSDSEDGDRMDIEIMTDKESKRKILQTSHEPRQSIIGERFDPSSIDDETFESNRKIFPKSEEQKDKILEMLRSIFLFNSLDEEQMLRVIESMFSIEVVAQEVVIKENDPGDNFYVIDHGRFSAYNAKGTIKHGYENEGSFGELALLYNCPRVATVVAQTEGLLWAINRISFRQLVLKSAFKKRKRLENLLKSIPILQELTEYDRCNLADALKTVTFHNSTIINQGDIGDKMYFIEDGEASVIYVNENGDEKEENRLMTGDYFGEVALLAKIPRIASVRAIGTVKVAELDVRSYNRLMGPCIDLMRADFTKYRSQLEKIMSAEQLQHLFPELIKSSPEDQCLPAEAEA